MGRRGVDSRILLVFESSFGGIAVALLFFSFSLLSPCFFISFLILVFQLIGGRMDGFKADQAYTNLRRQAQDLKEGCPLALVMLESFRVTHTVHFQFDSYWRWSGGVVLCFISLDASNE